MLPYLLDAAADIKGALDEVIFDSFFLSAAVLEVLLSFLLLTLFFDVSSGVSPFWDGSNPSKSIEMVRSVLKSSEPINSFFNSSSMPHDVNKAVQQITIISATVFRKIFVLRYFAKKLLYIPKPSCDKLYNKNRIMESKFNLFID